MGTLVIRPRAPLATQCDTAAHFSIYFFIFLSDWKQVCFHEMCFLYQQFAARRESQVQRTTTAQRRRLANPHNGRRGFRSAAAAADLPRELQLLRGCGLLSCQVRRCLSARRDLLQASSVTRNGRPLAHSCDLPH